MGTGPLKKYRILYVNLTSEIGGGTQSLVSLVSGLDRERFHPIVVLPDSKGPLMKKLEEHEMETAIMPLGRLRRRNPLPYLKAVFRFIRFIRNKRVDLVHSNIRFTNQYLVVAARLTGVPIISHVRCIMTREWYNEYFLWLSDTFIANSYATEESYRPYLRRNQKSIVIHNGVNLESFVPHRGDAAFRKTLGIGEDTFLIGVVARLVPEKGHRWFIQALKKLVDVHPNVCALFVGDTKIDNTEWYLAELKEQLRSLGLSSNVVFTGFVENVMEVYDSLDLLVLSTDAEPFGRVLIEAMAMEKPVVATKAGGAIEVVVDGKTGFLVPYQDTDALVNAMLEFVHNPQLGNEFGKEGRKRVEELFDIRLNRERTQQLYVETLVSKSRGKADA